MLFNRTARCAGMVPTEAYERREPGIGRGENLVGRETDIALQCSKPL
jgi:hypothetical protein